MDVSFYAFDLPWYRFLLGFGFAAVVLCADRRGADALPVRRAARHQPRRAGHRGGHRSSLGAARHLRRAQGRRVLAGPVRPGGQVQRLQGDAPTGRACGTSTPTRICRPRRSSSASPSSAPLLFFATLWRRTWQLPVIGFGLMVLSAILIGGLYPAIVQKFQVQPNEQAKEAPYIKKNIDATRAAYGIDGAEVTDYSGKGDSTKKAEQRKARRHRGQLPAGRPERRLARRSSSSSRSASTTSSPRTLDVDRYKDSDGKQQDTVVGLRELNLAGIPKRNWINDHFTYTHGYGVVAAKGTGTVTNENDGRSAPPTSPSPDCRPPASSARTSSGSTTARRPSSTRSWAAPRRSSTTRRTARRPPATRATSGVNLSNPLNRAAYAVAFSEPQMLYSGAIGDGFADPLQPHAQGARRGGRPLADHRRRRLSGGGRRPHPVDRRRVHDDQRLSVRLAYDAGRHDDRLADRPSSARWSRSRTRSTTSATR